MPPRRALGDPAAKISSSPAATAAPAMVAEATSESPIEWEATPPPEIAECRPFSPSAFVMYFGFDFDDSIEIMSEGMTHVVPYSYFGSFVLIDRIYGFHIYTHKYEFLPGVATALYPKYKPRGAAPSHQQCPPCLRQQISRITSNTLSWLQLQLRTLQKQDPFHGPTAALSLSITKFIEIQFSCNECGAKAVGRMLQAF
ncbi:hypothetical protein C8J57DRAFT_1234765 [Mycena rebaudengoi]|nr:hypothetical protein C8J57DRAFT_1234765 [Mycena rebaudengoi]